MNHRVIELEKRSTTSRDKSEKIDALISLCDTFHRSNTARAIEAGRQAVELVSKKDSSRRARALRALSVALTAGGSYHEARAAIDEGLDLAEHGSSVYADCLHTMGVVKTYLAEYPSAIEVLEECLEIRRRMQDPLGAAKTHNSLGIIYTNIADYPRALEEYLAAIGCCQLKGGDSLLATFHINIGGVYQVLCQYDRAAEHLLASLQLWGETDGQVGRIHSLLGLGYICEVREAPNAALANYITALVLARHYNARQPELYALSKIGELESELGDHESALATLGQALELARSIGSKPDEASATASIGTIELRIGRVEEGIARLTRAIELATALEAKQRLYTIHRTLAEHYDSIDDIANAYRHLQIYTTLGREVAGQEQQRAISRLEVRSELERSEMERERLRMRSVQLEQEMEHRRAELTAMALNLAEKTALLASMKKQIAELIPSADSTARRSMRELVRRLEEEVDSREGWKEFEERFESVHRHFMERLVARSSDLSRTELRICALLKLNLSSKEIADLLASSVRTVEGHRLRIRRKLELPADQSLTAYIASL